MLINESIRATAERIDRDINIFATFVQKEQDTEGYMIDSIFPLSVQRVDNTLDSFMNEYGENSKQFEQAIALYNNSFELGLKMGYIYGKYMQ